MASCGPPANSVRSAQAAACLLAMILASAPPAAAQPRSSSCCPSATERASRQDALERLKAAREAVGAPTPPMGPTTLPVPTDEQRKRAFDGLHRRAPSPAMEARARAGLDRGRTGLAAERDAMARRIGQALGLEQPDIQVIPGVAPPPVAKAWVPVLFASSSMPTAILRTYAAQLDRVRGVIAFRGMPGGLRQVAPMAKLTAEILRFDPGCEGPACAMRDVQIIVDPLLFRQHGVGRVPAFTMVPGDPSQPYCERENDSPRGSHLIFGDAALSGLIEEYGRIGGKAEVSDAAARIESR